MRIGLSEIFVDERDQARAYYTPMPGLQVLVRCIPRQIEYAHSCTTTRGFWGRSPHQARPSP